MKQIICVTGRQGTGKTTLCEINPYHVLPGKECRKHFGDKFFVDKKDPSCPKESEKFVRDLIGKALIGDVPTGNILWIDGFPRNKKQIHWLSCLCADLNLSLHIIFLKCDDTERIKRLGIRDQGNKDAIELHLKREMEETGVLYEMLMEIKQYNLSWSTMDNSGINTFVKKELPKSGEMSIKDACGLVAKYVKEKGWNDEGDYVSILMMKLHAEVSEAWEEFKKGNFKADKLEDGKPVGYATEMADVLIFTIALCNKLGIDLEREFIDKMKYNETRPYRHGNKKI